jgi:hypothetical protein
MSKNRPKSLLFFLYAKILLVFYMYALRTAILFAYSPNKLKYFKQILRLRRKNKEYVTQKEFQIQEMPDHVTMTVFSEIFKEARHYTLA